MWGGGGGVKGRGGGGRDSVHLLQFRRNFDVS